MENTIPAKVFVALQGNRYNAAVKAVIGAGLGHRPMTPEVHKHVAGALARLHAAGTIAALNPPDRPIDPLIAEDVTKAVDAAVAATKEWLAAAQN